MGFVEDTLAAPRPDELASVDLPRRLHYHPSPDSWQDEVVYFLLVDRFSDGAESTRPLLDRTRLADARPDQPNGSPGVGTAGRRPEAIATRAEPCPG